MRSRQARLTPGRAPPEFAAVALGALSSLYNFAYRLVGNEADAEDLVQDTYVEAFRHVEGIEEPCEFVNGGCPPCATRDRRDERAKTLTIRLKLVVEQMEAFR